MGEAGTSLLAAAAPWTHPAAVPGPEVLAQLPAPQAWSLLQQLSSHVRFQAWN